jgi:hypothetical protein
VRDDLTAGVHATPSRTGINTALVEAGPVLGTVGAHGTLGSTVGRRSKVSSQTGADTSTTLNSLIGKGTAKAVGTRVQLLCDRLFYGPNGALLKCIAHKTSWASTHRHMIDDLAFGVEAAGARARVHAFIVGAGLAATTVSIEDAFWPTTQLWVAKEAGGTGAGAAPVLRLGNGAGTAGAGVAGIRPRRGRCNNI